MFQGEGGVASASLPQGEISMPSVPNREGRENLFMEEFLQADRDVDCPDEGDVRGRIEVGREKSGHMGRPEGGEGCELRAEERRRR